MVIMDSHFALIEMDFENSVLPKSQKHWSVTLSVGLTQVKNKPLKSSYRYRPEVSWLG